MDKRRLLTVALVAAVCLHGFAGAAAADSSIAVSRATAAASTNDTVTRTVTYTFSPDSEQDVTASAGETFDSGNVVFDFTRWDSNGGDGGTGRSWHATPNQTYTVTFEVTVRAAATDQYYSTQVFQSGPYATVSVDVTEPSFDYIYTQDATVVFKQSDTAATTKKVEISNTGDGLMKPTNVTFSEVPDGFTVDYANLPDSIPANGNKNVKLDITADSSVAKGSYQFTATVHDNLGHSESFAVSVDVKRPPVVGLDGGGSTVDVGDVLKGSSKTVQFTVREQGGYSGISGANSKLVASDQFGSISFNGLNYLSTSPGGTDTAEATVSVSDRAGQHSDVSWTAIISPDDENGVGKRITFTGRVIYPAKFGSLSVSNTSLLFDRPKSQVDSITKTVTVEVPNTGDKKMHVQGVSAQTGNGRITANVVDSPGTIAGQSSGTVRVRLLADPNTNEGSYPLSVTVSADKAGKKTVRKDIRVRHGVELSVQKTALDYGDVIITKNLTKSTDVGEVLQYEDVTDLSITKVSGPDKWLTVVERPPTRLTAGDAAPFVVALKFDTSAKLYRTYTWKYRIDGDNVESHTVTITATAKPVSFDQIRSPLQQQADASGWRGETASGMVSELNALESRLRNGGDVSRTDLSTSVAAGRATMLFISSVRNASATMSNQGNEAAQDEVVRAAAAYNLLDSYVSKIDSPELKSAAAKSREAAKQRITTLVDKQRSYYNGQLDSENVSLIERAHIKRQLAELASLRGNRERAKRLRSESAKAFDAYTETVKQANEQRQRARQRHEQLRESTFTVVFGQSLVLNPASWDAFGERTSATLSSYDAAAASFEKAGATEEAQRVRSERRRVAGRFRIARYSMYGSTALYGLVFLGLLAYLVRGTYAYVRDAREAVSGDFLVAS